ncbi:hypothetical protein [Paenibacillus ihuae]|uniref:hypothetical protein n=1 Tax=Paenibacillus ihuae TaxID=1232431 RepID=UPI0006D58DE1|nr:hypothetical protein [Paenibacillus ihuae]
MDNYQEIIASLKQRFPEGTVTHRKDKKGVYIPNQVYTDRLESATGSEWDKEIKELDINVPHRFVKAIVQIRIGSYVRDGYGVSIMHGDPAADPKIIRTAVDQAVNEAFIDAIDTYEMGWQDLAPYKLEDWAGNPALAHLLQNGPPTGAEAGAAPIQSFAVSNHKCLKCKKNLSSAEWELLGRIPNLNRESMVYCFEDIPAHLKRKLPGNVLADFEEVRRKRQYNNP